MLRKWEPDQGYAWLVLLMSFLSHSTHIGFGFAVVGNLTIAHQNFFGIDRQYASYISSLHTGLAFLLAPLASVMEKKISCRVTEVVGGLSLIAGVALCSINTQPWQAFLFFGLVAGWGSACCYIASSAILAQYFHKYNYLSFAVAVLGFYCGMTVWPYLSQYFLDVYGYQKAMGYMSCFHIIHVIAGLLFIDCTSQTNETSESDSRPTVELGDDKLSSSDVGAADKPKPSSTSQSVESVDEKEEEMKREIQTAKAHSIIADFKILLSKPKTWLLLINNMLMCGTVSSFLILVNDYTKNTLEITAEQAALGLTIAGAGNVLGTLLVVVTGRLNYDRLILHTSMPFIFGIATIAVAFSVNKTMYYILAAVWGVAQGASIANLLAVTHDFSSSQHLSLLFGILLLFEGIGSLSATPLCGLVATQYGAVYGLVLSGLFAVVGSLVLLPVIIKKYVLKSTGKAYITT